MFKSVSSEKKWHLMLPEWHLELYFALLYCCVWTFFLRIFPSLLLVFFSVEEQGGACLAVTHSHQQRFHVSRSPWQGKFRAPLILHQECLHSYTSNGLVQNSNDPSLFCGVGHALQSCFAMIQAPPRTAKCCWRWCCGLRLTSTMFALALPGSSEFQWASYTKVKKPPPWCWSSADEQNYSRLYFY